MPKLRIYLPFLLLGGLLVSGPLAAQDNSRVGVDRAAPEDALSATAQLETAEKIMEQRELLAGRTFDADWRANRISDLAQQPLATLEAVLEDLESGIDTPLPLPRLLGDDDEDLVFTPLGATCRVYDSRNDDLSGPFVRDGVVQFLVAGDLTGGGSVDQGGASNCGIPFGPAVAVVANILAVDPQGKGNYQVWPFPSSLKGDSVINFAAQSDLNINLINGVMIPICNPAQSVCGFDSNAELNFAPTADFLLNVTGYFSAPDATPLDCTTVSDTTDETSNFSKDVSCPAGYTLTGGGHNWFQGTTDVWFWQVSPTPSDNGYRCRGFVDRGGSTSEITCYARCCRVPGN